MNLNPISKRLKDLQENVNEMLQLIKQYEDK